ncbi:hypothetical protein KUCAC02_001391, partial [Chaenocephalus aceratus]
SGVAAKTNQCCVTLTYSPSNKSAGAKALSQGAESGVEASGSEQEAKKSDLLEVISRLRRAEEGGEELPCCSLRTQGRSGIEVDNEQRDKVELWRSYHPEPPGHTALLV